MSKFETATTIELEIGQIDQARAVLEEASHYFEYRNEVNLIPMYADHILKLIYATDKILYDAIPKLKTAVNDLYDEMKKEREDEAQNRQGIQENHTAIDIRGIQAVAGEHKKRRVQRPACAVE